MRGKKASSEESLESPGDMLYVHVYVCVCFIYSSVLQQEPYLEFLRRMQMC